MAYRILSFCGGGIRGILSSGLLNQLYQSNKDFVDQADLLAGTSTGADIVSMIVAGLKPDEIYSIYVNRAPLAFQNPQSANDAPAYDSAASIRKPDQLLPIDPMLSALPRSVLMTAFNVGSKGQNWTPLLLNNLPGSTTADTLLSDAAMSSSAMPGMYGSHNGNIDGAFVNHDPTLAAIALAVSNGVDLNDIAVICFGTGFMGNWIASDTSQWGALQWQQGDGNENSQTPKLLINGTISPILNACLNGTSTNLIPQRCGLLLGGTQANPLVQPPRYAYLNPPLNRIIPENDTDPADLKYMEGLVTTTDISHAQEVIANYWTPALPIGSAAPAS